MAEGMWLVPLFAAASSCLITTLLSLELSLVLCLLLVVRELHLVRSGFFVVEIAGICALDFLQDLGEDKLGMIDRIEYLTPNLKSQFLDFFLSRKPNGIERAADVPQRLCQHADDCPILST
jgi:hypothetical protein